MLLKKSIYGLVQAARQWWKKFVQVLESIGFVSSQADPCLLYRKDTHGTCIVVMYVDDMCLIGHQEAVQDAIKGLTRSFKIKVEDVMTDYLGCEFKISDDKRMAWLGQPNIVASLRGRFGDMVKDLRRYNTPGTPSLKVVRPQAEDRISEEEQAIYRSGTGMLLYLIKHSRPDIGNPTRELSKAMDGASKAHLKEMLRVIKFVLDTEGYGLKFKPNALQDKWILSALCDSDFAGDTETRVSVGGYVVYLMGVPIAWRSKGMKSVCLSSTEAEYVAVSEVVKEISFILQVLESMEVEVELPVIVQVDNVGAIWLANNKTTSDRTKHVDIRAHFTREFIEAGKIKIVFVRSKDNDADIFTKNISGELYHIHSKKLIWTMDQMHQETTGRVSEDDADGSTDESTDET